MDETIPIDKVTHSSDGLKTVTIMITLHGGILQNDPLITTPTHTAIGTSPGLCVLAEQFPLTKLNHLKKLYAPRPTPLPTQLPTSFPSIREANAMFAEEFRTTYKDVSQVPIEHLLKSHTREDPDVVIEMYKETAQTPTGVRKYSCNNFYNIENDRIATKQGIFIVYTNSFNLQLHQDCMSKTHYVPTGLDLNGVSQDDYSELQNLNLINVAVAEEFFGKSKPYGDLPSTKLFSGIEHYSYITLNHILDFFGKLGIEHVNVLDLTCRVHLVGDPPSRAMLRATSMDEKEEGSKLGGKRRKTQRKIVRKKSFRPFRKTKRSKMNIIQ